MSTSGRTLSRLAAPILALAMGVLTAAASASQSVILSTDSPPMEIGQGFLVRYADQCRLIMPTHVAAQGGVNVRREGLQPVFGALRNEQVLGDDISLFEVEGVGDRLCGESLSVLPRAVDAALRGVGTAHVRFVNGDGTTGSMAVAIVDNDLSTHLRVKPVLEGERISRGMSGSQLVASGMPVGMLLSVNARSGVGTILRQDALIRKVEAFLRQDKQARAAPPAATAQRHAFLKLVGWDAPPEGAVSPDAIVSGEGDGYWRVAYPGKPVTLDFELSTPGRVWSGVRIDARDVPGDERPEVVELLMAAGANPSSWMSVKTSGLEYIDDVAQVSVAPRKGASLRLRLARKAQQDSGTHLGVRRIEVLP